MILDPEKALPRDEVIRSRLLNRLGIHKPKTSTADNASSSNNNGKSDDVTILRRQDTGPTFCESLNDSHEESVRKGHQRRPSRKRLVRFDSDVLVTPIASHKNYSKRIKQTLWTDTEELQDNAYRNHAEFAFEGFDYEKVLEDEDMYIDAETGELVHPFWIEQEAKVKTN